MKRISIVGFGRFGRVLYRLLKDDFAIMLYDERGVKREAGFARTTSIAKRIGDIYESETVFYAVPIESFEKIIAAHKKYFKKEHLLIDVLSVKMHPARIFAKYLKGTRAQALLTHPMFGPDSSASGFAGLPIVMDKFTTDKKRYDFWKKVFAGKKLKIVEMNPYEHDKLAADSQGLTHFIGRLMEAYPLKPSPIDSIGTKKLLEVEAQTRNDTWQLFENLQHYNTFTKHMRIRLGTKYGELYNRLLPRQIDPRIVTYGIQGGRGSFNEEAMLHYLARAGITKYRIKYLHTSASVMRALHKGEIDCGQVAIHNSVGGMVDESIQAMAGYRFRIIDQFAIKISHALMIRPDARLSDITTIMSHPQVFAQCKNTLARKYPLLKQVSGSGKLIDHAMVAKRLGEKKLGKHVATMGSSILAKLYDLTIVEDNLQDAKVNDTSFLHMARIHGYTPQKTLGGARG